MTAVATRFRLLMARLAIMEATDLAQSSAARDELGEAIREATAAGVPVGHIAEMAGVSLDDVERITSTADDAG